MGGLRPIGSEKLQGMAKINRILEIARYKENIPKSINENKSTEYSVNLADGYTYEIVKEKMGYIIKQQITEGFNEYIEPMKNRKYYPSYSQALKRLNLMAKEMNTLYENKNGTALFEGDKKYVLKMNSGLKKTDDEVKDEIDEQTPPAPAPAPPAPAPAPAPAPEGEMAPPSPDDMAPPAPDDMGDEEEMDTEEEGTDEEITFKTIQKLTGKLAQKIRDFEGGKDEEEEGMDGNDVKYVINSILSALDLSVLDEDDIDEIMSRLEGEEGEEGEEAPEEGGEMEGEEPAPPPAPEEEGELAPPSPEGEMAEMMTMGNMLASKIPSVYGSNIGRKMGFDEDFDMEDEIIDVCSRCNGLGMDDLTGEDCEMCGGTGEEGMPHKKMRGARKHLRHGTFSESTIDNIISKYFEVEENEKYLTESRKENSLLEHLRETKSEIKRLSKTSRQANVAMTFLKENKNSTLVGISNKNNLIFKLNSFNYKISPKGNIL